MRRIWVLLLATAAFAVGVFLAMGRFGHSVSTSSIRIGCDVLEIAEASKFLDSRQRNDVVERVQLLFLKYTDNADPKTVALIGQQLRGGCRSPTADKQRRAD
jgi:hypothetical protein